MPQEKEYFAFISYQRRDEEWADKLRNKLEHYRLPSSVRKLDASLPKENKLMRTNRFALILLLSSIVFPTLAQTQQGYVKTLGRPDKKGVALSGVSVRLKGGHNAVLSKDDGTFSMLMTGMKVGDAYSLQQVQKAGYELNEIGVIGRLYAFSDKVPLNIVMVSTSQLQAEKQRIENNAYKVAEKNYHTKLTQLEKDKESGAITIEQYRTQIQDLQDKFEKYQSLIDGLAEHYAHTDYDALDENEREINICIENGDLERADSLIHTIFDPIDVLKRNKEALSRIDQNLQEANDLMAQANADMAAVLKQQEKDAEHLYQLYTIALAKFDNEKAGQYIETRAALDTTNVDWQNQAGQFLVDYLSECDRALEIYQRGLLYAQRNKDDSIAVATCYNNMGMAYCTKGEYQKALEYLTLAFNLYIEQCGTQHHNVALAHNNLANAYQGMGDNDRTIQHLEKSLEIRKIIYGEDNINIAIVYNNLGYAYMVAGQMDRALELITKSLEVRRRILGEQHQEVGISYSNLGNLLVRQGKVEAAYENFKKAYEILIKVYGEQHPLTSTILNNIGYIFQQKGNYETALQYYKQSSDILLNLFGEGYAELGIRYNNIGEIYRLTNRNTQALEYYQQALKSFQIALPQTHPNLGILYCNIGLVYYQMQNYEIAEHNYKIALDIIMKAFNERHYYVALIY